MTQERSAIGKSGASDIYEHLFLIGQIWLLPKIGEKQGFGKQQSAVRHGGRVQAITGDGCLEESERAILGRMSHI